MPRMLPDSAAADATAAAAATAGRDPLTAAGVGAAAMEPIQPGAEAEDRRVGRPPGKKHKSGPKGSDRREGDPAAAGGGGGGRGTKRHYEAPGGGGGKSSRAASRVVDAVRGRLLGAARMLGCRGQLEQVFTLAEVGGRITRCPAAQVRAWST